MASNSHRIRGRPLRNARQLDLNFSFNESDSKKFRLINKGDCRMDVKVGIKNTLNSTEVTMLQNELIIFFINQE